MDIGKVFYQAILDNFILMIKILWTTDEFKSAVIGIPLSVVTFKIVGWIFSWGRNYDIWFGRTGGKIMYYMCNSFLVWIVMKII